MYAKGEDLEQACHRRDLSRLDLWNHNVRGDQYDIRCGHSDSTTNRHLEVTHLEREENWNISLIRYWNLVGCPQTSLKTLPASC